LTKQRKSVKGGIQTVYFPSIEPMQRTPNHNAPLADKFVKDELDGLGFQH
jgi:hypothetical protein